ncbi:hypothetical protein GR925_35055 [Streptomyces sp. HUCO-GS316]|uniref:hypothetical protein n=1 Tax=Streptomyces sp. HUCO-GS316 TaxID=2692198 RepID=UPI0013FE7B60|nr:hypothetical protein [Streptomyces sp. HUCO-GS316]MXM68492.1 hypothetical protein [Streptomyces sp. HUCO-GS316]
MRERTAAFIESLLLALVRALLPARGRHRAVPVPPQPPVTALLAAAPVSPVRRPGRPLDDVRPFEHNTPLVRPYLLTPDERHERKQKRRRRRALWLAAYGIDVGPRHIHGMEVSA